MNWLGRIAGAGLLALGVLALTPRLLQLAYFPVELLLLLDRSRLRDWQLDALGLALCVLGSGLILLTTRASRARFDRRRGRASDIKAPR